MYLISINFPTPNPGPKLPQTRNISAPNPTGTSATPHPALPRWFQQQVMNKCYEGEPKR